MHGGRSVVYVSIAGSGEIAVLGLDPQRGTLAELQRIALGGRVMPLALNPQRSRLYAARRSAPLAAISLAIGADGLLAPLGEAPVPASMAYLATDRSGRFLLSASYGEHVVAVSAIDEAGRALAPTEVHASPPNAHAIQADPANRYVFSTHLGADLLQRYDFAGGRLLPQAEPALRVASTGAQRPGPRHFAFHPGGAHLYLLNELDASVCVCAYDAADGSLAPLQRVSTLPPGFAGEPWAAEIRIAPDGRHLYTSERRSSTLAAFRIDAATGWLSLLGHVSTEAQPRGFAVDPGGRWLVVAGERSGRVCTHAIDDGRLAAAGPALAVGSEPNWVEIVKDGTIRPE